MTTKYILIFLAVIGISCHTSKNGRYPTPEELTGIYRSIDTSRHEALSLLSSIPFSRGNWTLLYLHVYRGANGKQITSTGQWDIDLSKGLGPDYDFGYPKNKWKITFYDWKPYPGDSIFPYDSPEKYFPDTKGRNPLYGWGHYESDNSKVVILDSFYREPQEQFRHERSRW